MTDQRPPSDDDPDASGTPERADDASDPRMRGIAITLAVGGGIAVVAAVLVGLLGGSGAVAAVVLLLVLGTSFAVTSLWALGTALVDEFRHRPVGRVRVVVGIVLFVASVVTMAMAGGAGGGGGGG